LFQFIFFVLDVNEKTLNFKSNHFKYSADIFIESLVIENYFSTQL